MRSPFRSPSPVSVLDGLPLTSASLELPAFQKASADHSVLKFALSQQRYAHLYVVEGAKAFASWENSDVQSAKSVDIIAVDAKARDLLSSPLLRPRVGYNDSHSNNRSVAPDSVVSNTSPRPVEKGGAALARAKPQKTARRDSIKGKDNKKKAPSAKPAATLEEEEAKNRLAERRDRKRAKRAILKPPTPAASSTASSSRSRSPPAKKRKWDCVASPHDLSLADMHREARTGADRKTKNDTGAAGKNTKSGRKKVKIAPGLALMQNFSAKNIGRERITLKPSSRIGLFNKGVASASTHVNPSRDSKGRTAKARPDNEKQISDLVFSEFAFLNKAHQTLPAAPPSVPSSSSSSSSSTGCSDKEEASPDRFSPPPRVIQEKVSRFFKPATARKPEEPTNLKKAEVEKNASLGPTNASVLHQSPHSPSSIASNAQPIGQKSSPRPRHSSPTWDIELGLDLPSDDESLRNIELAKRENRALDLNGKWSGPKDVEQSKVETTISGPPGDASSAPKPKTPSGPFPDRALSPISDGLSPSHVHIPPTRHTVDPPVRLTPAPSFRSLPPFNTAHEQVLYVVNETALVEIQNHPTIRPAASAFHTEPHPVDASSRVPLWLDHDHDHDHNSILPQSHHVLAPVATSLQSLIDACDAELQSRAFERRHRRRSKSHSTSKRRDVPCASRVDSVYVAADNDAWRCEVPDEMARQNQNGGPYWHLAHIPDYDCAGGDVEMDDCAFPAATGWYIDDENEHDEPVFEDQGLLFDEGGACEYSGEYDSRLASAFDGGAVSYDVLLEEERWQDSEEGNNSELDHGSFDPEGLLFPASCEAVAAQEDGGGYDVFNDGDVRFDMAGQSDVVDFPFYDDGLDDQRSMISSSIPDDSSSNLQLDQTHAVSKYPTVSSNDHDHFSYPAPLQPFSQGRALLLGIEPVIPSGPDLCLQPVGRDHWRRFKL